MWDTIAAAPVTAVLRWVEKATGTDGPGGGPLGTEADPR